jgi:large subunit ribosomal protein L23
MALFKRKTKNKEEPKKVDEKHAEEQVEIPAGPSLPKGGDASSYQVILSPHITEKGTLMSEQNKYVFRVAGGANKIEVKRAVGNLYKVKVEKVRVMYAKSKLRTVGRREGHKPGFKKAIVTLREGSKIDIAA